MCYRLLCECYLFIKGNRLVIFIHVIDYDVKEGRKDRRKEGRIEGRIERWKEG